MEKGDVAEMTDQEDRTKAFQNQAKNTGDLIDLTREIELQKLTFNELDVPHMAGRLFEKAWTPREEGDGSDDVLAEQCLQAAQTFLTTARRNGLVQ